MKFLKITAANGTQDYVPDNSVISIKTAADTLDAGSDYSAPKVIRGRITEVVYYVGSVVTTVVVAARTTGGVVYEYGCKTNDGAFSVVMSN
jgi:hypothetical protein